VIDQAAASSGNPSYRADLQGRLPELSVNIIVEAFRPNYGGGFRSAIAAELKPQLAAYDGYPLYLFDGPRYVTPEPVKALGN
jgi:hypothetical protein